MGNTDTRTLLGLGVKGLVVGLGLAVGVASVAAWTGPTGTAPNSNTSAPLNVSATAQTKAGNLTVTGNFVTSGTAQADRYYDDNAAYYVDSNSTSVMNAISAAGNITAGSFYTSGGTHFPFTNGYNYLRGHTFFNGVLYDENNSGYYLDPAGGSSVNSMYFSGLARLDGGFVISSTAAASFGGYVYMGGIPSGALDKYVCLSSTGGYYLSRANSCTSSDARLKEHIKPITKGLAEILKLNPVEFEWKDKEANGSGINFGLVAQEVIEVLPEAVTGTGTGVNGDYFGLNYDMIAATLVKAVQELKAENDELRAENEAVWKELKSLRSLIENK